MTDNLNDPFTFDLKLDKTDFDSAINDATRVANTFSRALTNAFVGVAAKGKSLGDVVNSIGLSLSRLALNMAFKPIETGLQGLISPLANGLANIFTPTMPTVTPMAKGGVISAPTFFQSGGGFGMAGERGAEAILPLARGNDGSLGVRIHEQVTPNITINIATPDVDGFRRSQSEIAASLARMVSRGRRGT
jgi:phage-related minor tail protein